jgi:hypothetical protein
MKPVEEEVSELEALINVLCSEYNELVALFYMAHETRNPQVRGRYESEGQQCGFEVVRAALFRSLFLALAKIIFDDDKTFDNPSIKRLHWQFAEERKNPKAPLLTFLRNRWADRLNAKPAQFDALLDDIFDHWDRYSKSPIWQGLKTLRNKVIAHSDLTFSDDKWRLIDPNELQFGVDDYDKIRVGVQDFLSAFHFAITGMHLNFDAVHEKAKSAAIAFWHAERS